MSGLAHTSPVVSVVVPMYNAARHIADALESLRAQTQTDWQAILVDDGSTDDTAARVARRTADPRITVIAQPHQGLSAARNAGLARCTGAYVAFLDADDMWLPTYLERMLQALQGVAGAVAAFAGWQYVDAGGRPLPQTIVPSGALGAHLGDELRWRNPLVPSGVVVRRTAIDACRGFDPDLIQAQDWDLWLRLLAHGPFLAVAERLVWYRTHGDNLSDDIVHAEASQLQVLRRHLRITGDPASWSEPQRQAIGYLRFVSALAYFRKGDCAAAIAKMVEAMAVWPALAERDETYYELGCADRPRGWRGPFGAVALDANRHLIRSLVFEHWPAPSQAVRNARWAHACLVLSQLACEGGDRAAARRLAIEAGRSAITAHTGRVLRALLRASIPGELLRRVRSRPTRDAPPAGADRAHQDRPVPETIDPPPVARRGAS